jgi:hypothetical protein
VLIDEDSKTLRKACKRVARSAHGAIVFLLRKAVLPEAVFTRVFTQLNDDHNDGDHNGGDHNGGGDNDARATTVTTTTAITSAASTTTVMALAASAAVLAPRLCLNTQSTYLAATPTSPIRAGSSRRVTAKPPAAIVPVDATANHLSDTTANPLSDTTANRLSDTTANPLSDTTANRLSDTTEPALKKQRLATLPERTTPCTYTQW